MHSNSRTLAHCKDTEIPDPIAYYVREGSNPAFVSNFSREKGVQKITAARENDRFGGVVQFIRNSTIIGRSAGRSIKIVATISTAIFVDGQRGEPIARSAR